jgi:biopolymer transport protein ExbD
MRFDTPRRTRDRDASIVPMINVVFLLLIFFLMTAQIAPPDPLQVDPPETGAQAEAPQARDTVYLDADGRLAYGPARGTRAVIAALKAREDPAAPVVVRADAGAPAADLARLLARLAVLDSAGVELVTVPR